MKNDFKKMEDEMDCLSTNMAAITDFSAHISGTLQDQHAQITKLSGETRDSLLSRCAGCRGASFTRLCRHPRGSHFVTEAAVSF